MKGKLLRSRAFQVDAKSSSYFAGHIEDDRKTVDLFDSMLSSAVAHLHLYDDKACLSTPHAIFALKITVHPVNYGCGIPQPSHPFQIILCAGSREGDVGCGVAPVNDALDSGGGC